MKKLWHDLISYLNIEPDAAIANAENYTALKTTLTLSVVTGCLALLVQKILGQEFSYYILSCLALGLFMIAYCAMRLGDIRKNATMVLEIIILLLLLLASIVEYSTSLSEPVFGYLILIAFLPGVIFDRPWKLLGLIMICFICSFLLNLAVDNEAVFRVNVLRLVVTSFLSVMFTCRAAHSRILAVQQKKNTQVVAEHDPLTGIYNRGGGTMLIKNCIERHKSGTFIIVDVDDFKMVNDHYGHQKGDEVLKETAAALRNSFKDSDIVMRMGGDEFVVYALGMVDYNVAVRRLEQLVEGMHEVVVSSRDNVHVTVSVGAAINDGSYPSYEALFQSADGFLYKAKSDGKDGFKLLGVSYK